MTISGCETFIDDHVYRHLAHKCATCRALHDLLIACEELSSFVKLLGQARRSSFLARNDLDDYDSTWRDHVEEGFLEPYDKCIAVIEKARGNDKETN